MTVTSSQSNYHDGNHLPLSGDTIDLNDALVADDISANHERGSVELPHSVINLGLFVVIPKARSIL